MSHAGRVVLLVTLCSSIPRLVEAEGFDAQRFVPAVGAAGGLMVERPVVPRHLGFGVGLLLNYAYRPVILQDDLSDEIASRPLAHALTFDLLGSIGLFDFLELGLHLPIHVYSGDEAVVSGQQLVGGSGIGDIRLMPKAAWWLGGSPTVNFSIGIALPVTLPTGNEDELRGAGGVTLEPRGLFSLGATRWAVTASFGYRARLSEQAVDFAGRHTFTYGVAGTFGLLTGAVPVDLQADLVGSILGGSSQPGSVVAPLELLGGVIVWPHPQWSVYAAVGPGLTRGLGTPDVRFIAGVRFARRTPGRDRYTDSDGDRVPDYRDDCPGDLEDYDGFEDDDGCNDGDNDHDGIPR